MTTNDIFSLATKDYQNRNGKYPQANIPDTINVKHINNNFELVFSFANTTESCGKQFVENYISKNNLQLLDLDAWQDGVYQDEWIIVKALASN